MGTKRQRVDSASRRPDSDRADDEPRVKSPKRCNGAAGSAGSGSSKSDSQSASQRARNGRETSNASALAANSGSSLSSAELPPKYGECDAAEPLEEALRVLNAAFAETVREKLREDPACDLTSTTLQYAEDIRSLRAQDVALTAETENDEDRLAVLSPPPAAVAFVASSDLAERAERELEEDEVYFGASLDLNAFSSTSRQSHLYRRESGPLDAPEEFESPFGGFVASQNNISGSIIWNDPVLTSLRVPSQVLRIETLVHKNERTEIWRGAYSTIRVAVKRLVEEKQTMENAVAFAMEVRAMAHLRHTNVVALVGVSWEKALDFHTATEFMEHGDLRALLDSPIASSFTWAENKCQVAIQIAEAFAYLHSQSQHIPVPITSRKVLVDGNGTAKLNVLRSSISANSNYAIRWMAPEVLSGGPRTTRSDMFTFGVLLTELDTAKMPYFEVAKAGEEMALAQKIICGDLQPTLSPDCPDGIAKLARECLARDPLMRPDAERVIYALREILKNEC